VTTTFALIHGANGNSFTFAPLQRELAMRGHRSLAVDLPGHGFEATVPVAYQAPQDAAAFAAAPAPITGVTLADCVEHVAGVLRRAKEHGPVVVLAHSRGGLTLTALANEHPDLVDHMVYMAAWCCVERTLGEYMERPEYASSALGETAGVVAANPLELGAIRMNWRTADPELLAAVKRSVLAGGTDDEFLTFLSTLQPDDSLDAGGPEDRARAETWGRIPRTYVRLTRDASMPPELQDLFIAEADALTPENRFDVRSLDAAHVEPLIRPEGLAAILASLA
jgi:pimeloyl-ACP methyl ester carboxylesterase